MDIVLMIFAVLTIVVIINGVKIVQQAEAIVIERLGKYNRVLPSGLHIIIPFIERVRQLKWRFMKQDVDGNIVMDVQKLDRIDLREKILDFPRKQVITKDNVILTINAVVYFQISDPMKAIYEIDNLPQAIETLTQTSLRNVTGGMELDECLVSRTEINIALRDALVEATNKWGVKVSRVEILDITPPEELRNAMEKQMRAERDRRAMILEAEGKKRAMVLEAEGRKEAQIKAAEGDKEAQILHAFGEAEARIQVATAEGKAIQAVSEAFGGINDPGNYLVAIKYIEALQDMAKGNNNKLVFMPYEASGVLSSIGGIKEMLKDVTPAKRIAPTQNTHNTKPTQNININPNQNLNSNDEKGDKDE